MESLSRLFHTCKSACGSYWMMNIHVETQHQAGSKLSRTCHFLSLSYLLKWFLPRKQGKKDEGNTKHLSDLNFTSLLHLRSCEGGGDGIVEIPKSIHQRVSCVVVYYISTGCVESFHSFFIYLIRIVHQWTVITMITNSIPICICLFCVVDIRAIISFIKNICQDEKIIPIKPYV